MVLKSFNVDLSKYKRNKHIEEDVFGIFDNFGKQLRLANGRVNMGKESDMVSYAVAVDVAFSNLIYNLYHEDSLKFIAGIQSNLLKYINEDEGIKDIEENEKWVNPITG